MSTKTDDQKRIDLASTLTDIERLYALLPAEAIARGAKTDEYPGGDVTNLLAHAAHLEAWNNRYYTASDQGFSRAHGHDYAIEQVDGERHPQMVLTWWLDNIDEARGHTLADDPQRRPVSHLTAAIRNAITWIFDTKIDGTINYPPADALLADLRRLRTNLETVLHEGWRPEYGAPCLHCRQPLERIHHDRTGFSDDYRCSSCGRMYLRDQYEYAVGVTYLHHAPALTATQIETREGISATRIRVWGCRYEGLKAGKSPEGLWLYNVEAVLAKRDALNAA